MTIVWMAIIYLNERFNLLSCDRFTTIGKKYFAYAWLGLSAMSVEDAFFRAWMQKRIGLIASTTLFALAHFSLGQPLLLIGVTVISLVIGFTFYRTKNVLPGVVAHGVFDSVQLFVIIP